MTGPMIDRARQHLRSGEFLKLLDRRSATAPKASIGRPRRARAYLVAELTPQPGSISQPA
jgi:hypothetical protein